MANNKTNTSSATTKNIREIISYIIIAFLCGYQLRGSTDYNTNSLQQQLIVTTTTSRLNNIELHNEQNESSLSSVMLLQQNSSSSTITTPQPLQDQQLQPTQQIPAPTTQTTRPNISIENTTKCERQWDWPFIGMWQESIVSSDNTDDSKLKVVTQFLVARSNTHETARGTIDMKVIQFQQSTTKLTKTIRVVIYVTHHDSMGANAWHRIATQYMVWISWQVAYYRLLLSSSKLDDSSSTSSITNIELALPCKNLNDIPQGWNDLVFTTMIRSNVSDNDAVAFTPVKTTLWCIGELGIHSPDSLVTELQPLLDRAYGNKSNSSSMNSNSNIDVVIVPPDDGLLWDVAWDTTFNCRQSRMFRTFLAQFAQYPKPIEPIGGSSSSNSATVLTQQSTEARQDMSSAVTATTPTPLVVCWILRYDNPQRVISNRDAVHGMLLSIFDTVRLLHITKYHTSYHIINIMNDCHVLYGVHGAGMVNAMWGTLSSNVEQQRTAVVEVLPANQPQYFRSLSALVGHYYEGVLTSHRIEEKEYFIDLDQSAEALRRAANYVEETNR